MKLVVLLLLLSFGMGFFLLAYFQSESRRGGYAMLSGFILVMIAGLLVAGFGLEYRDGYTITDAGVTQTIDYDYVALSTLENLSVALPLILAGLWGTLVVFQALRETRNEVSDE